jgi:hypothetical protein
MGRGSFALRFRGASWRRWSMPALVAMTAMALSGCGSISQKFADGLSQAPAIGLPSGTPERPAQPLDYPAVHDMPAARNSLTLTSIEQQKMEDDLMAARDQQQKGVGMKAQPKTARQIRQEKELKQRQARQPIAPVSSSSSRSIY